MQLAYGGLDIIGLLTRSYTLNRLDNWQALYTYGYIKVGS